MITDRDVLNPYLFRRLTRLFGVVHVIKIGEAMTGFVVTDANGVRRYLVENWGEAYRVCCPLCDDHDFGLAVNHRYGQRDDLGRVMSYAAFCRHAECHMDPRRRHTLYAMVRTPDGALEDAVVRPGVAANREDAPPQLPRGMTRLDQLPRKHPARRDITRLGLDPDRVGRVYEVGYCDDTDPVLASRRIIVPYRSGGRLQGWQTLTVDSDSPVAAAGLPPFKLYHAPGMRATSLVYNQPRASRHPTVVIVPSPVHVWLFGSMAVSFPGDTISTRQCDAIRFACRDRHIVLLFDRERLRRPSIQRLISCFRQHLNRRFLVVTLPYSRRGELLDRAYLRGLVADEAARMKIKIRLTRPQSR